jgi:small subunit ribosomal protein S2
MSKYKTPKIEDLFDAGVHIGHQARRWHPKMEPYIFSVQNKVHVFNLELSEELLKKAADFMYEAAKTGAQVIFVGTKRQASAPVMEAAKKCGALYVTERWLGGTITNHVMIKRQTDKLLTFLKQKEDGTLLKYTKKERLMIDREIEKLQRFVGGIVNLHGKPAAMFVVDPRKEKTSLKEAKKFNIPVVALIDTNSDPSNIDYVIPGNDDAIKSIRLIADTIADAVEAGYKDYDAGMASKAKEAARIVEEAAAAAIANKTIRVTSTADAEVVAEEEVKLIKKEVAEPLPISEDLGAVAKKTEATGVKKPTKKGK